MAQASSPSQSSLSTVSQHSAPQRDVEKQDADDNDHDHGIYLHTAGPLPPGEDGEEGGGAGGDKERRVNAATDGEMTMVPDEDAFPEDGEGVSGALNRVLSRISHNSRKDPGPPPDGGWRAWGTAFSAHLVIMNTWGVINSFGAFQETYETLLAPTSASAIAWIGSVQVFLVFFIGTFSGRLTDAGLFRPVFVAGAAVEMVGIFTAAQATTYWQLLLAQGLCLGLGNGLLFCPSVALVNHYFDKRRGLAYGIASSGTATGALVFPAMVQQLLPRAGFAWTMRAIGFIQLACFVVAGCVLRPRLPPRRSGALIDWATFRDPAYCFFVGGVFFAFFGIYFAFWYLATYSTTAVRPPFTYAQSLDLLIILNGVGLPGRLVPNYISDRLTGPLNLIIPGAAASSVLVFAWAAVRTPPSLYAWSVLNGICAASVQGLFPACMTSLTSDRRKSGIRLGMAFTALSFAVLTGPPIGGAIIARQGGGYTAALCFMGATVALGTGLMVVAKVFRCRALGVGFWSRM